MRPRRPDPPTLDVDAVAVVTAGTVVWAVALAVTLLVAPRLREHGHGWWIATCATGFALGLLGIGYCRRRRAALRRSRSAPPASPG